MSGEQEGAGGFDVAFPSIRDARESLKRVDAGVRGFGVAAGGALDDASVAAGTGDLVGALGSLSSMVSTRSNKTANLAEELWQALAKAQEAYEATDQQAGDDLRPDIARVRFGDHDGHS